MKKLRIISAFCLVAACITIHAQDIRLWSTYYGGLGNDGAFCLATDKIGNTYMAGITNGTNGIASSTGFQTTFGGGNVDAYLVKFGPGGARQWATFYGGPGDEMPFFGGKMGLAVDTSGNVYLAGISSSTSGIASAGAYQSTHAGGMDAYLVKFDHSGNRLWATYYGGASVDYGYSVAVDPQQNVYLAGVTGSTSGISSSGFQNIAGGSNDAFLVKFDPAGSRIWATYYGGTGSDEGYSVATDAAGNVFLAGSTTSSTSIASGGFQNTIGGGSSDAFLVKFSSAGTRIWSTYYGGSGDESVLFSSDIETTCDANGNVYLAGLTSSTGGIASGGFQNTFGGGQYDAFLASFDALGNRNWATYYGGSDDDKGYHVGTDTSSNIFLSGLTLSANAIASGGFQNTYGTNQDGFLVKFTSAGIRTCASYFGGSNYENCEALSIDPYGNIYICGGTATNSGLGSGGYQNTFGGGSSDGYLVKFSPCSNILGVTENNPVQGFLLFPNPNNGQFIIRKPDSSANRLQIFDATGKVIWSELLQSESTAIDLTGLAPGLYLVGLSGETTNWSQRILIE